LDLLCLPVQREVKLEQTSLGHVSIFPFPKSKINDLDSLLGLLQKGLKPLHVFLDFLRWLPYYKRSSNVLGQTKEFNCTFPILYRYFTINCK
jgi:hypothetical protein